MRIASTLGALVALSALAGCAASPPPALPMPSSPPAPRIVQGTLDARVVYTDLAGEHADVQLLEELPVAPLELVRLDRREAVVARADAVERGPRASAVIEQGVVEIEEDGPKHRGSAPPRRTLHYRCAPCCARAVATAC